MLRDKIKAYDKKYGTGNFIDLEEGPNQLRILTEPELYDDMINGEPGGSFIAYVLLRDPKGGNSTFGVLNLSKVVVRWLGDEQDAGKFTSFPMPYDIMIFRQKTGQKSTYVSVAVSATDSPSITSDEQNVLHAAKPIVEVALALAAKKTKNAPALAGGVKSMAPLASPALPAANSVQAKRNQAEMNPMFTALETAISSAGNLEKLKRAQEILTISMTSGSIDAFEGDLLQAMIKNKTEELSVVPVNSPDDSSQSVNVEDIQF